MPELDGLRFVAIVTVFLYHLSGDVIRHTPPGVPVPRSPLFVLAEGLNIGVPLFFAISGMILGLPFANYWLKGGKEISIGRYFLRRITRLEPPYIISLLLFFTLKFVGDRGTITEMLPHLGASFFYLHNVIYREFSSINPVAWSLEIEVQFYIIAPILAVVFALRSAWLRRSVLAAAILLAALNSPWAADPNVSRLDPAGWLRHLSLVGNIQYFLTGFLLADFFLVHPPAENHNRVWDAISVAGWPLLAVLLVVAPVFVFTALPAIILLLYGAVFYGPASRRAFGTVWVASIGGMCYSIYLIHNYAIALLGFITERLGQDLIYEARLMLQFAIMGPIVLFASICFYRLVEQPCMRSDWPTRLRRLLVARGENHSAR
jgi:peptidoglycan/LPS O-acetylase OafA/YrhL